VVLVSVFAAGGEHEVIASAALTWRVL